MHKFLVSLAFTQHLCEPMSSRRVSFFEWLGEEFLFMDDKSRCFLCDSKHHSDDHCRYWNSFVAIYRHKKADFQDKNSKPLTKSTKLKCEAYAALQARYWIPSRRRPLPESDIHSRCTFHSSCQTFQERVSHSSRHPSLLTIPSDSLISSVSTDCPTSPTQQDPADNVFDSANFVPSAITRCASADPDFARHSSDTKTVPLTAKSDEWPQDFQGPPFTVDLIPCIPAPCAESELPSSGPSAFSIYSSASADLQILPTLQVNFPADPDKVSDFADCVASPAYPRQSADPETVRYLTAEFDSEPTTRDQADPPPELTDPPAAPTQLSDIIGDLTAHREATTDSPPIQASLPPPSATTSSPPPSARHLLRLDATSSSPLHQVHRGALTQAISLDDTIDLPPPQPPPSTWIFYSLPSQSTATPSDARPHSTRARFTTKHKKKKSVQSRTPSRAVP